MGEGMAGKQVQVDDEVDTEFKKLWKNNRHGDALILKIDKDSMCIQLDEELTGAEVDDVTDELPETKPRYIVYSCKWERGDRVQMPISLIYYKPENTPPNLRMLYTGPVIDLQKRFNLNKVFEVHDSEDFTKEWLLEQLATAHS